MNFSSDNLSVQELSEFIRFTNLQTYLKLINHQLQKLRSLRGASLSSHEHISCLASIDALEELKTLPQKLYQEA